MPDFDADLTAPQDSPPDPPAGALRMTASGADPYVPIDDGGGPTMLEELTASLTADVETRMITLAVPGRPGFGVRYRANLSDAEVQACRKQARRPGRGGAGVAGALGLDPDSFDALAFATAVVVKACEGILSPRGQVVDAAGLPVRFNHGELLDIYKTASAAACALAFYGQDSAVIAASDAVLQASGWAQPADELDDDDLGVLRPDPPRRGSPG